MPQQTLDVSDQISRVTDRLAADYRGRIPEERIRTLVREAFAPYSSVPVTQFVPVLVDRSVRDRLRRHG